MLPGISACVYRVLGRYAWKYGSGHVLNFLLYVYAWVFILHWPKWRHLWHWEGTRGLIKVQVRADMGSRERAIMGLESRTVSAVELSILLLFLVKHIINGINHYSDRDDIIL